MWIYEKKLEHPVNIKSKDLKMAQCLMTQYGGAYCNRILDIIINIHAFCGLIINNLRYTFM